MPSSEVTGNASGACSGTPSGSGPCPPLESVITVVVCPRHLQTTQEAPRLTQPTQEVLHSLLLVAGSLEITVIRHVWALTGVFGSVSSREGVFPGE